MQALILVCCLVAAQVVVLAAGGPGLFLSALAVSVPLGAGYVWVMPRWRYRIHRWEVDELAVYTQVGWVRLEWRIAPISRIQTIDTTRSPLQRLFGLATVTVTTASSAGAVRIEGLAVEVAADLARRLTEITQRSHGDAT